MFLLLLHVRKRTEPRYIFSRQKIRRGSVRLSDCDLTIRMNHFSLKLPTTN
jgi:hypothetical protein